MQMAMVNISQQLRTSHFLDFAILRANIRFQTLRVSCLRIYERNGPFAAKGHQTDSDQSLRKESSSGKEKHLETQMTDKILIMLLIHMAAPCQAPARQWPKHSPTCLLCSKPLAAQWKTAAFEEHSKSGAPVPSVYS